MTVDEFIELLRERNTGAPAHIVVMDDERRYWDPEVGPSRIAVKGEEPYGDDNDFPFAFVIHTSQQVL
jgi:hypothetical protein